MELEDIARQLNAKKCSDGYRAKCPAHKDKSPSLWFGARDGKLYFDCKRGCHYMDVRAAIGLADGEKVSNLPDKPERDPIVEAIRRKKILNCWEGTDEIVEGSLSWLYLYHRKVISPGEPVPEVLRCSKIDQPYYNADFEKVGEYHVMYARLQAPDASTATLHRTYISDQARKAPVEKPKKLMTSPYSGCTDGGAIRLHEPIDGVLGIAEGIETALACRRLYGISVWAAWSAGGLQKFQIPSNLTSELARFVIFADNDDAGIQASNTLKNRLHSQDVNLEVIDLIPKLKGSDFWDEYVSELGGI